MMVWKRMEKVSPASNLAFLDIHVSFWGIKSCRTLLFSMGLSVNNLGAPRYMTKNHVQPRHQIAYKVGPYQLLNAVITYNLTVTL